MCVPDVPYVGLNVFFCKLLCLPHVDAKVGGPVKSEEGAYRCLTARRWFNLLKKALGSILILTPTGHHLEIITGLASWVLPPHTLQYLSS